jgi:hypothetical protein
VTPKEPPRLGTLILERLGPQNDGLRGDLEEEWQAGRSAPWYWQQIFVVIAHHCIADVRRHWMIGLRGIVTGLALLLALGWTLAPIEAGLHRWVLRYVFGVVMMTFNLGLWIHLASWFPASVVAGWIVARLHLRQRAIAILGLVFALGALGICNERFYFLVRNSLTHERFVPYLIGYVLGIAVGMAGVLVGGLMQPMTAARAESSAPSE